MMLTTLIFLLAMSMYTLHPLVIILSLIGSVVITSILTMMTTKISLFGYMIMLMLLGGLIILFIYMASIAPNDAIPMKFTKHLIMLALFMSFLFYTFQNFYPTIYNKPNEIIMLMNNPTLVTLAAIYLFITLIAVVQITKIKTGPLRSQI